MRSLIISLVLTALLVCTVICNALYVRSFAADMKSLIRDVQQDTSSDKAFYELRSVWDRERDLLALSVHLSEIDRMNEYITRLGCAVLAGDCAAVEQLCSLLLCSLNDIIRHERIALSGIL